MCIRDRDTSTPCTALALGRIGGDADGLVAQATHDDRAAPASSLLAPRIAGLLAAAGITPGQLGAIACGVGPGTFTGTRVALAPAAAACGHAPVREVAPGRGAARPPVAPPPARHHAGAAPPGAGRPAPPPGGITAPPLGTPAIELQARLATRRRIEREAPAPLNRRLAAAARGAAVPRRGAHQQRRSGGAAGDVQRRRPSPRAGGAPFRGRARHVRGARADLGRAGFPGAPGVPGPRGGGGRAGRPPPTRGAGGPPAHRGGGGGCGAGGP